MQYSAQQKCALSIDEDDGCDVDVSDDADARSIHAQDIC